MFKFIEMEEAGCAQLGGKCRSLLDNSGTSENGRLKNRRCVFFCVFFFGGEGWSTNKTTGRINDK